MEKIKVSKKNIKAIEERLCDYITAIKLNLNLTDMPGCTVCDTATTKEPVPGHGYASFRDCSKCALSGMKYRGSSLVLTCMTKVRGRAIYGGNDDMRERYKEIVNHVNKRLAE